MTLPEESFACGISFKEESYHQQIECDILRKSTPTGVVKINAGII